ncbi:MAG: hypothetical protein U1C74_17150 [Phenylobacterium sp.]|nr:hypothetical protein [Phenylobacterium sp.]
MATLTEMVAAVVVHSSAAAFSHFGVTLEAPRLERPATPIVEQRTVARSPRRTAERSDKPCPDKLHPGEPAAKATAVRA